MNDPNTRLDAFVVIGLLLLLAGILATLAHVPIPKDNQTLFAALAMAVSSGLSLYLGYRWGSSKGSAAKDATIADLAKGSGQ